MRLDLWNAAFRSSVVAYASSGNLDVRGGDRSRFGLSDWTCAICGCQSLSADRAAVGARWTGAHRVLDLEPAGYEVLAGARDDLELHGIARRVEPRRGRQWARALLGRRADATWPGCSSRHSKASVWFLTMDDSALVDRLRSSPPSRATPGCSWYRGSSPRAPPPGPPCPRPPPCPAPARRTRPGT